MSETITLEVLAIEDSPTMGGKFKVIAITDKGKHAVWDKELAADLAKACPILGEAKVTYNDRYGPSIQQFFPLGKGSPKPQNTVIGSNSNKDNDIRAAVALKAAVDLINGGKLNEILMEAATQEKVSIISLTTKVCYNILKEVAK